MSHFSLLFYSLRQTLNICYVQGIDDSAFSTISDFMMDIQHVAGKTNAVVDCQGCYGWVAEQPGEILVLKTTCTGLKFEQAVAPEGVSTFICNISTGRHCPIAPMAWHRF